MQHHARLGKPPQPPQQLFHEAKGSANRLLHTQSRTHCALRQEVSGDIFQIQDNQHKIGIVLRQCAGGIGRIVQIGTVVAQLQLQPEPLERRLHPKHRNHRLQGHGSHRKRPQSPQPP